MPPDPGDIEAPVTGAWLPGDPVGRRRFHRSRRPMALEGGGTLHEVTAAYETWGELDADATNAVLICHALTGDAHVHGRAGPGQPTPGWWDRLVGPGAPLDTSRLFVVCVNVLGGCQGSTGPSSIDPDTGGPYGSRFPLVSVRDMVRVQHEVANLLGIARWQAVVGGSMGGMQALEWAVTFPERVGALAVFATTAASSAQQIAWSRVGRQAIVADPGFRGGDYYDAAPGEGPHAGLALAREIAMIHYRSAHEFQARFGRQTIDIDGLFSSGHTFEVESYLAYQGRKFVRRFDANSYLVLNRAMDLHDLGRGRAGVARALDRIRCPSLIAGVNSDFLYPMSQQLEIWRHLERNGVDVEMVEIDSPNGHDGFLTDDEQLAEPLHRLLVDRAPAPR